MDRKELIRTLYLYLFSFIGLVLVVIGSVGFVDLGLKVFIFRKAEQVIVYPQYPRAVEMTGKEGQPLTAQEAEQYRIEQEKYEIKNKESERERTAARSLAMIFVGAPLFLYHWKVIQKGKER